MVLSKSTFFQHIANQAIDVVQRVLVSIVVKRSVKIVVEQNVVNAFPVWFEFRKFRFGKYCAVGGIVEQKTKVRLVAVLLLELNELVCYLLIALDSCFPSLFQGQVRHFFEYRARKWRAGERC